MTVPNACTSRRRGCKCDLHPFKDTLTKEVIESALYTDDGMFGEIRFEAEEELKLRFPPPDWKRKHMKDADDF